jgi:pimeloyl-ACP methyl ester carboxylesterase
VRKTSRSTLIRRQSLAPTNENHNEEMTIMTTLAYSRSGAGAPLVLLHGIGLARGSWEPVVSGLAEQFDVLAVDLPGFGESEMLPDGIEPSPAALAAAVAGLLDELGIADPHIVGNSLGGWVALELAQLRPVASVTLLSPAGLWPGRTPRYCRISLRLTRWLARHGTRPLARLVRLRMGRRLVFIQVLGRPAEMTPDQAAAAIRAMGNCPGFDATLTATLDCHYVAGTAIDAPVTVAFGGRDRLLPRRARRLDELPAETHVATLPQCGHVPMTDDPAAVTAVITEATARAELALS